MIDSVVAKMPRLSHDYVILTAALQRDRLLMIQMPLRMANIFCLICYDIVCIHTIDQVPLLCHC